MFCKAAYFEEGREVWAVVKDPDKSDDLQIRGTLPAELEAIHRKLIEKHNAEDAGADFIFDAPPEFSKAVCGYRGDEDDALYEQELPVLIEKMKPRKPGFLSRLFGG